VARAQVTRHERRRLHDADQSEDPKSPSLGCDELQLAATSGDERWSVRTRKRTHGGGLREIDASKKPANAIFGDGPGRDRTCDLGIKSPLLYQLSYRPAHTV
jgi:hypothetical protein